MQLYTFESVERFIAEKLVPLGYDCRNVGGSLVDSWVCIAPDAKHWNFEFRERYISGWASGLSQRRTRQLSKWAQKMLSQEVTA